MVQQKELVWGIIASMWIGNAMLLVINLPLIGLWVRLRVPYKLLFPSIMVLISIGTLSVNNLRFEILLTALFGFIGWLSSSSFGFEARSACPGLCARPDARG